MKHKVKSGPIRWNGRRALALSNNVIDLVLLAGGGHVASLSLAGGPNLLWQAEWKTIEPQRFLPRRHSKIYGEPPAGNFLAHFTGHVVCTDYFGPPSPEEEEQGLPLHGEVASGPWKLSLKSGRAEILAWGRARALRSQLCFEREVRLLRGESIVYFRERLINERAQDRFVMWIEHATFGKPMLVNGESVVALSGAQAITWPNGYDGKALLPDSRRFTWPLAPTLGGGDADLSHPFAADNKGFVVGVLVERERRHGFVAVLNWKLGIVTGYCFRRVDFPWIAVWEENRARKSAPWKGRSQARALEFGTSPSPVGLRETISKGPVLGERTFAVLPAKAAKEVAYLGFVARVGNEWRSIRDVRIGEDRVVIHGGAAGQRVSLSASGLEEVGL
jgi:hypothetical protein